MNRQISIYDHLTGETIVREMTNDEQAQFDAEIATLEATRLAAEAEAKTKKATAEAKLATLGLTAEDLQALGLGGN